MRGAGRRGTKSSHGSCGYSEVAIAAAAPRQVAAVGGRGNRGWDMHIKDQVCVNVLEWISDGWRSMEHL